MADPKRSLPARLHALARRPRLVKFGLIGATGVAVNLGLLWLLVRFTSLHYALASPLAIEASILGNYLGNRLWTWRDRRVGWESLLHFHGVSLIGMLFQWITLVALVEFGELHYLAASLAGIGLGTAWNFFGNHHFTFAHHDSPVRKRLARPLLYAAAFLLQAFLGAFLVHAWDGFVFEQSVKNLVLEGETPYETIETPPAYAYNRAYVPPFPEWYAYPPLTLLLFSLTTLPHTLFGLGGDPVFRVLWKLPIILGALGTAYVARRLAEAHGAPPSTAVRLERLLLFNPFVAVIGAIWGMTEPIMLVLLLASLWALHRRHLAASGVLFGMSALVKIFPLFLYPLLLAYAAGQFGGWRAAARHATAAGLTWMVVSLPFLAFHPQGFLELVFAMHVQRPPSGYTLFLPLHGLLMTLGGPDAVDRIGPLFSVVGLTLYFGILAGTTLRVRASAEARTRLPITLALTYLLFLIFNKVVHAQYLLTFLVLVAVAAHVPNTSSPALRRVALGLSTSAAAATLLDGLRLFRLLPPDVAPITLGEPPSEYLVHLRQVLHISHGTLVTITGSAATALVLLPILSLLPAAFRSAADAFHVAGGLFVRVPHPAPRHALRRSLGALLLLLVMFFPTASLGLLAQHSPQAAAPLPPLGDRALGAYYYLWWDNPSHDDDLRYGNWAYATTTPLLGYYSSYAGEIEEAARSMRSAGVDFALVPLHGYDHSAFDTLAYVSERIGFRYAPLFDLATFGQHETRVVSGHLPRLPLTKSTIDDIQSYIDRYSTRALSSPNLFALEPGRPLVFFQGARLLGDPDRLDEQAHIAQLVVWAHSPDLLTLAVGNETWTRRPELLTPAHFPSSASPSLLARFWEEARADAYQNAWRDILARIDQRIPGAVLVLAAQDLSAPHFPLDQVRHTYDAWEEIRPGATSAPLASGFRTLYPQYDALRVRPGDPVVAPLSPAGLTLARQWSESFDRPALLIHSWNEHEEGTAIEPTWQWGDRFLDATARWSAAWHSAAPATLN